jgi:hypothetical protein
MDTSANTSSVNPKGGAMVKKQQNAGNSSEVKKITGNSKNRGKRNSRPDLDGFL